MSLVIKVIQPCDAMQVTMIYTTKPAVDAFVFTKLFYCLLCFTRDRD